MLLTNALVVPDMAREKVSPVLAAKVRTLSPLTTSTLGLMAIANVPLAPFIEISESPKVTSTPFGNSTGLFATLDIVVSYQNTVQRISPPIPAALAARSVITPRLVVTIAIPRPLLT